MLYYLYATSVNYKILFDHGNITMKFFQKKIENIS